MESEEKSGGATKYIAIILGIVVIILLVMWVRKPSDPVTQTFEDISADLAECQARLTAYQETYADQTSASAEAEAELQSILADCEEVITASEAQL